MQTKLELFSPDVVSASENKELLSYFIVYKKSATSAQTEVQITTDGSLYTGIRELLSVKVSYVIQNTVCM